ncbi:Pls/PosA family non-ribosomal peptide synthetase [Streptomyces sp. NPDC088810]|uniref:Pls/PosA family non-ribosomal peptide synthetase n=1 Tax=Streptomyces sp. NPDC088810 TaxID=3365904 RepID=UPI00381C904D
MLFSAPGRAAIGAGGARLLTRGMRAGSYPRGGRVHLRLWAAERLVAAFNVASVAGTPLAPRYARWLGCTVGDHVALHALPPVTGLAEFGAGSSIEPEADVAGWWLDGDVLHVGSVRVGPEARVGTRSVLMPGAEVGAGAEIAPGCCVTGPVPALEYWHGSPARPADGDAAGTVQDWPAPEHRTSRRWGLAYLLSLPALQTLPLLAAAPAGITLFVLLRHTTSYGRAVELLLLLSVPAAALTYACYAGLLGAAIRLLGCVLAPGLHPGRGKTAWAAWLTYRLMDAARTQLFPIYASLLTPVWLRLLGARVGRRVEASTVLGLPGLMTLDDGAFLADDTLVAPFEVRGGWLRLGEAHVGRRALVGNSGIVGPGRRLPENSLVGVLSDTPAEAAPGSSWIGRPGLTISRVVEPTDTIRTYEPPRRLVWARVAVELCRLLPLPVVAGLGDVTTVALQEVLNRAGLAVAALAAGPVVLVSGVLALLTTTAAKWLLVGRFRRGRHPLWSSFVWRNELYDVFVEELAMPWLGQALLGTPFFAWWLRTLGPGSGVACGASPTGSPRPTSSAWMTAPASTAAWSSRPTSSTTA